MPTFFGSSAKSAPFTTQISLDRRVSYLLSEVSLESACLLHVGLVGDGEGRLGRRRHRRRGRRRAAAGLRLGDRVRNPILRKIKDLSVI